MYQEDKFHSNASYINVTEAKLLVFYLFKIFQALGALRALEVAPAFTNSNDFRKLGKIEVARRRAMEIRIRSTADLEQVEAL